MATETSSADLTGDHRIPSESLYEVINGEYVELPPMGTGQELTAGILQIRLGAFADTTKLGRACVETLFDFTEQVGHKRRPDVAFVSSQRWPRNKPVTDDDGWLVVPELAVEIVSRSNLWNEVQGKMQEYFQVGVQRVWVVSTVQRQVHVYSSPTTVRILSEQDELTDNDLLPGFVLALRDLFELV